MLLWIGFSHYVSLIVVVIVTSLRHRILETASLSNVHDSTSHASVLCVHTEVIPPPPRGTRAEEGDEEASTSSSLEEQSLASLGRRVVTVTGEGEADGLDGEDC